MSNPNGYKNSKLLIGILILNAFCLLMVAISATGFFDGLIDQYFASKALEKVEVKVEIIVEPEPQIPLDDWPDTIEKVRKDQEVEILNFIKIWNPQLQSVKAKKIAKAIIEVAENSTTIDYKDLTSLIAVESDFRINPVNKVCPDATGLTQVRSRIWTKTLKNHGIIKTKECLKQIYPNVKSGAFVLDYYLAKSDNNLTTALRKYNAATTDKYVNRFIRIRNKI
jgi:soluble lytic murein transglycosylase-like protein